MVRRCSGISSVQGVVVALVAQAMWWPWKPRGCGGPGGSGGVLAVVAAVPAGCRLHSSAGGSCAAPPVPLNINAALHCAAAPATGEPRRPSGAGQLPRHHRPAGIPAAVPEGGGDTPDPAVSPPQSQMGGTKQRWGHGEHPWWWWWGCRGVGSPPDAPRNSGILPRAGSGQDLLAKAAARGSATIAGRG